MSKPKKHMKAADGGALCGRTILDTTTIKDDPAEVTCPQCIVKMQFNQFDEADHGDPETNEEYLR